jgi:hypothetical protein
MGFDPCNHFLKIRDSTETPIPKVGALLGVWRFISSHSPTLLGAWNATPMLLFWPTPLQTIAFVVNPKLGLWKTLKGMMGMPVIDHHVWGHVYGHDRSRINCGSCVFTIAGEVISIKSFSVAIEVCSLVSLRVGTLYITFSWLSCSQFGFYIFGAPMQFISFDSFMTKDFHKLLRTISSLLMLANSQVSFAMFSLCYA